MKKQNNISIYTKQIFSLVLMSILFFACQEEEIIKNNTVEEGIPVEIALNVSAPEMTTMTRGLRDEEEFQINDLYLLIFDSEGKTKAGTQYYSAEDLNGKIEGGQASPTHGTISGIKTTSGKSYIFAAANVGSNQLSGGKSIKEQLEQVNNISDLKAVTATLNSNTSTAQVDRTQAALVMCGAYTPASTGQTQENEGECNITKGTNTLNGKIVLERLDSHITFKISWGGKNSKVTSFELTGWKVYNVPIKSYLLSQEQDAVKSDKNDYAISPSEQKVTTDETGKSCSFDFYMLENRKHAKLYNGKAISSYAEREAEVKNNNLNTGEYKFVEPYATYVEIQANMELESSNTTTDGKKVANVKYTIHLGGGERDYTNFKSERNKKYTYNVTIVDTEDIRVEVQNKNEVRPGVEGDVIDAKTKVYTLDAHYNCFIIGLTKTQAKELSFMVKTPFGTSVTNTSNESERKMGDYKWIRFKRCTKGALATYPKNGSGLIDLFGLASDITSQSGNNYTTFYYTVFVDEYYYDQVPAGENWTQPYWKYFVNKENRYVILLFTPEYSLDKESSYADAQYLITQRSIQTYYSTEKFNSGQTALGMEHVNETGEPSTATPGISDLSNSNGYYNMYKYINRNNYKNWNNHASITSPNTAGYTFNITKDNAWSDCLSRNRDENNNGVIEPEELKWYLPTRDQLTGMFLGAESLTTPLFDADSYPQGSVSLNGDTRFHYLLSNNQKIWGEEGCSIGDRGYAGQPKQIRCVRNLNLDMNSSNATTESKKVGNVFTYNSTNHVFNLEQMDAKNIRGKVNGELGLHDNFSISNRPYKAFQMAKNFHTAEEGYGPWGEFVNIDQNHNSLCKNYYEKANRSDKGKWRTPNQREFMIMYTQDINFIRYTKNGGWYNDDIDYRAYTRTEWKYNKARHFGYNNGILFLDQPTSYNISLRCVRDVDVDSNGNIINE